MTVQNPLDELGFVIAPNVLNSADCMRLIETLRAVEGPGQRGVLGVSEINALANSEKIKDLVRAHLLAEPRAVRSIYFNKSPETNWAVSWHQDVTIAVRERADLPGFQAWSVKKGVVHVQPPTEILEQMVTVRIHLDHCDERNGALEIIPSSHRYGRLTAEQVDEMAKEETPMLCSIPAGGVLLMRPLLLHSSRRSESNRPRRVLHVEYAGFNLPKPLKWAEE
jgi:ectoine hydroxylase-related dioxygenase (phytanoyl-CoA dioxygenase family)